MITTERITVGHLKRKAYLYVRQSTLYQTEQNPESLERQYDFRRQALSLGWHQDQIVTLDEDLGQSGAEATHRTDFQRLVADVGLGQVGVVLSLEISRLARNSADWHRLLELCAMTDTLILDEDGLYDPNQFNDRLLLGLRGTMSEAELHFLRARLYGGKLNKARRGELRTMLPAGLIYDPEGHAQLDPDRQIQQAIRKVFDLFHRFRSAWQVVCQLQQAQIRLPVRLRAGPQAGETIWTEASLSRVLKILKNPRYAGTYFYGRTRQRKGVPAQTLPADQWKVQIPNAHPGYIPWEQFEANQQILAENNPRMKSRAARLPPRQGPALLQGILLCGRCGRRMTVYYNRRSTGKVSLTYCCGYESKERGGKLCQLVPGRGVDQAISQLAIQALTPEAVDAAVAVFEELKRRNAELAALYQSQVDRARHEAESAQRQFFLANPENRLVADNLEKRWNDKLRALAEAENAFTEWKEKNRFDVSSPAKEDLLRFVRDFPALWNHPNTTARDRKQMLRLMIQDVTLLRQDDIHVCVRWKGGATSELHLPRPLPAWESRQTPQAVLDRIAGLAQQHTDEQIAEILTHESLRTGTGLTFTYEHVTRLRIAKRIPGYYDHLRRVGMVTCKEIMARTGVGEGTIREWRRSGLVRAIRYSRKRWLYEFPGQRILSQHPKRRPARRRNRQLNRYPTKEA
jgi:DNA invertase Pin-like site-specific DNA recombinase